MIFRVILLTAEQTGRQIIAGKDNLLGNSYGCQHTSIKHVITVLPLVVNKVDSLIVTHDLVIRHCSQITSKIVKQFSN